MKKSFIFDFDGVICDSEKYHYLAWKEVAENLNVNFTREEYVPFQSTGRRAVITYLCKKANVNFTEELFSSLSAVKSSVFARLTNSVGANDLIKGVDTFIKKLKENGAILGMASSASTAKKMLKTLDLDEYFDVTIDGSYDLPKKPDPTIFLTVASLMKISPSEITVFEDSAAGVEAALKGGFDVVGIGNTLDKNSPFPVFEDFTGVSRFFNL